MCRTLKVHPSGYYEWLKKPYSARHYEELRLLELIKLSYEASGRIYGSKRIYYDLREMGETCSKGRVERIMRKHKIQAVRGYKRRWFQFKKPSVVPPNHLQQAFTVPKPDYAWVTDITYIRTHEGWLYLAVVMDLFSRKIIGWSMKSTLAKEIVLDALLMAV